MQGIIMKEDLGVSQTMNKDELKKVIALNVKSLYRKTIDEATPAMIYQAVALAVKDMIIDRWIATHKEYEKQDAKVVYYMSMEFLTGRFLGNNIISLCEQKEIEEALSELGFDLNSIEDQERDPALGNGGLGRLALIHLLHWDIRHMAAASVIVMECSNSRSVTDIRSRSRMSG